MIVRFVLILALTLSVSCFAQGDDTDIFKCQFYLPENNGMMKFHFPNLVTNVVLIEFLCNNIAIWIKNSPEDANMMPNQILWHYNPDLKLLEIDSNDLSGNVVCRYIVEYANGNINNDILISINDAYLNSYEIQIDTLD